jgi:hypothetical protein
MNHLRWLLASGLAVVAVVVGIAYAVRSHHPPSAADVAAVPSRLVEEPPPELTLPKAEREYIWEIEHHGNVLSRYGFGALAAALRRADADALNALCAADFTGRIPAQPRVVRLDSELAQLTRLEDSGAPATRLDRDRFVAHLLTLRRRFTQPPQVKLALMGLGPEKRDQFDGPWAGTGQLRMWGEAGPGQPTEVILHLEYHVPRPTPEALGKPGWLRECRITQSQEAQAPHFLLRDVTTERGIDPRRFHDNWRSSDDLAPVTGGVYLCDFNRDGILDMLVTDVKGYVLYRGLPGGKFEDVTLAMGLLGIAPSQSGPRTLAAFADLDGDGWEDLILGNHVYRNDDGKRFVDVTQRTNLYLPEDATGIAIADFDRDGRLDLYVTRHGQGKVDSWLEGRSGSLDGNVLWRNLGNWRFQDVTASSGAGGDRRSCFTALWFDADNDGWPDLYVPNEFGNGVLLRNQHDGTFKEIALVSGPGDFGTMGLTCGDIDNDGRIDLYSANMYSKAGNRVIGNLRPDAYSPDVMARLRSLVAGSQLYLNRGDTRFEPVGKKYQVAGVGWAYGAALVDLDNDGWLDLYATCGYVSRSRDEPDG